MKNENSPLRQALLLGGIQHFSLHEGPGLRTAIYFKGCPLRCAWCCNPELQDSGTALMYQHQKCLGTGQCGACLNMCPADALYDAGNDRVGIDRDVCNACGICFRACPTLAMAGVGRACTVDEVLAMVLRDAEYIQGVTLSGGEPLMRPAGAAQLLNALGGLGLHRAVSTCGFFDLDNPDVRSALGLSDLVLFDIKHISPQMHKSGTEVENARILHNLERLGREFPALPLITRTAVVPGFNDSAEAMTDIARTASRLPTLLHHEIFFYHPHGEEKYNQLGRPCLYSWREAVNPQLLQGFARILEDHKVLCKIL